MNGEDMADLLYAREMYRPGGTFDFPPGYPLLKEHPAAQIFPCDEALISRLRESLRNVGQINSGKVIWVDDDLLIVDGRARFAATSAESIPFRAEVISDVMLGQMTVWEYALAMNLCHSVVGRAYEVGDHIRYALRLLPDIEREAAQRMLGKEACSNASGRVVDRLGAIIGLGSTTTNVIVQAYKRGHLDLVEEYCAKKISATVLGELSKRRMTEEEAERCQATTPSHAHEPEEVVANRQGTCPPNRSRKRTPQDAVVRSALSDSKRAIGLAAQIFELLHQSPVLKDHWSSALTYMERALDHMQKKSPSRCGHCKGRGTTRSGRCKHCKQGLVYSPKDNH